MPKQQIKVVSPDSTPQMPDISPNHNIKILNLIPYNDDELDTKTHNHCHPTLFSLSQEVYFCILKPRQFEIACGIIDDHGGNLKYKQLIQTQ